MTSGPIENFFNSKAKSYQTFLSVFYKRSCATIPAASFGLRLILFDVCLFDLDRLDLEMETNEGEHQALQVLKNLSLTNNRINVW